MRLRMDAIVRGRLALRLKGAGPHCSSSVRSEGPDLNSISTISEPIIPEEYIVGQVLTTVLLEGSRGIESDPWGHQR